jgi:hypothetical protein
MKIRRKHWVLVILIVVGVPCAYILPKRMSQISSREVVPSTLSKVKDVYTHGIAREYTTVKSLREQFQIKVEALIEPYLRTLAHAESDRRQDDLAQNPPEWLYIGRAASASSVGVQPLVISSSPVVGEDGKAFWILLFDDGSARLLPD